jgi:hypothetical protein
MDRCRPLLLAGSALLVVTTTSPAAVMPAAGLAELAREATVICTCRMVDQRSDWDAARNLLVSVVHLQAEDYLKGGGTPELVVELVSGFGGEKGRTAPAGAAFEQGERAVIFLKPSPGPADGEQRYQIVNGSQGKFTIRVDPETGQERIEWNWQGPRPPEMVELRTLEQLKALIRDRVGLDNGDRPGREPAASYAPGELLVKFKPGATAERISHIIAQQETEIIGRIDRIAVYQLRIGGGRSVEELVRRYSELPEVDYAEPNYLHRAGAVPSE